MPRLSHNISLCLLSLICAASSQFVTKCSDTITTGNAAMTVAYDIGTVGGAGAIQFTVTWTGDYGAIAFRPSGTAGGMRSLDTYAFDTTTRDKVQDGSANGMAQPTADAQQDAVVVSHTGNTVVFYRLLTSADATDRVLSEGLNIGFAWAVGAGKVFDGSWSRHTTRNTLAVTLKTCPAATDAPATSTPAAAFTVVCSDTIATGNAAMTVAYDIGTVGGAGAIQFTVTWTGDYGAIAFRPSGTAGGMSSLDTYAFDTTTRDKVQDGSANGMAQPTADAQQDAVVVSHTGNTVVFYRLLTSADATDRVLSEGLNIGFAWAVGAGKVFDGSWSRHTTRNTLVVTLKKCATDAPTPVPDTDAPTAAPTAVPDTDAPTSAPTAVPATSTPAAAFTVVCSDTIATGNAAMTVAYDIGTVGGAGAIQFTVTWTGDYGAIAFRPSGTAGGMSSLDTYAFDTTTRDKVQDGSANGMAQPTADAQQDAVVVSHTGNTVVFYRLLTSADATDRVLSEGLNIGFAWAVGAGKVFDGSWSRHTTRNTLVVTLKKCATDAPTPVPDTDAPTSAPTAVPDTDAPTAAPTAVPDTDAPTSAPTAVPATSTPAAAFTVVCSDTIATGNAAMTVAYDIGTVGGAGAIQFTVTWTGDYGAIAFRPSGTAGGMSSLDTYAFDTTTRDKVQDGSANGMAQPTADAQQDAVVVSHTGNTVVFYRLLTSADATDRVLSEGLNIGFAWAVGAGKVFDGSWSRHTTRNTLVVTLKKCATDAPTPVPDTDAPTAAPTAVPDTDAPTSAPTAVPATSTPAAAFTVVCSDTIATGNAAMTVAYDIGTVGGAGAIQFTVTWTGDYGAIAFRPSGTAGGMSSLDTYAFDTTTRDKVQDGSANGMAQPTADAQQDAVVVSHTGNTVVFYRLLTSADATDRVLSEGLNIGFAWAVGAGKVFDGSWSRHTTRNTLVVTLKKCATDAPTPVPDTDAPTSAPTAVPDTDAPTAAPTAVPDTDAPTSAPTAAPNAPSAAPTAVPDTDAPATDVPATSTPAGQFTVVCSDTIATGNAAMTVAYDIGTVGSGTGAIQFTVTWTGDYGAIAFRPSGTAGGMSSLDTYAFDTTTRDKVQDGSANGMAQPTADAQQDAVVVSHTGNTVVFYRLLTSADATDRVLSEGLNIGFAWAVGAGKVFDGSWSRHTTRNTLVVTLKTCATDAPPTDAPTAVPDTDAPTAAPTAVPDTDAPTSAPTAAPNAPSAAPTAVPDTDAPATDVPATSTPAGQFTVVCSDTIATGNAAMTVAYDIGTVGAGTGAIQFTVTWTGDYGAIAFRPSGTAGGMSSLDTYAFDTTTRDKVQDGSANGMAQPTADAQQDAVVVSHTGNTVVFYRLLTSADATDRVLSEGLNIGFAWAVGAGKVFDGSWSRHTARDTLVVTLKTCATDAPPTDAPTAVPDTDAPTSAPTAVPDTDAPTSAPTAAPTAVPDTDAPATDVPATNTPAGQFTVVCSDTIATGNAAMTVAYDIGTVGSGTGAIQFTVTWTGDYGAIAFRPSGTTSGMRSLDTYAFDTTTRDKVQDGSANGMAQPTADAQQDAVVVSHTGNTVVFYRLLTSADATDRVLSEGLNIGFAWAVGAGKVFDGSWSRHTARDTLVVTLKTCATDAPPTAAPTAVPDTDAPTSAPTAAPNAPSAAPTAVPDTDAPATDVPATSTPAGQFTVVCSDTIATGNAAMTVAYDIGTVGAGTGAIQFTVTWTGDYGAIAFRPSGTAGGMRSLDTYAFDTTTRDKVQDGSANGMAKPTADTQQGAVVVSHTGNTVVFYRLLTSADVSDTILSEGLDIGFAWAVGAGKVFDGSWSRHTARDTLVVTLKKCATDAPPTDAPTAATDAPMTDEPATLAPGTTAVPATGVPATDEPSTLTPGTTAVPDTDAPLTDEPSTLTPGTTAVPMTDEPSTLVPGTTAIPDTGVPSTDEPSTLTPGTTAVPMTDEPATLVPGTTAVPMTDEPATLVPGTTAVPMTDEPATLVPGTTAVPSTMAPVDCTTQRGKDDCTAAAGCVWSADNTLGCVSSASEPVVEDDDSSSNWWIWVLIAVGIALCAAVMGGLVLRKRKQDSQPTVSELLNQLGEIETDLESDQYAQLDDAPTNDEQVVHV